MKAKTAAAQSDNGTQHSVDVHRNVQGRRWKKSIESVCACVRVVCERLFVAGSEDDRVRRVN